MDYTINKRQLPLLAKLNIILGERFLQIGFLFLGFGMIFGFLLEKMRIQAF